MREENIPGKKIKISKEARGQEILTIIRIDM